MVMAVTLIVGERGPQVLEKVVCQRYIVTDCSLTDMFIFSSFLYSVVSLAMNNKYTSPTVYREMPVIKRNKLQNFPLF